MLLVNVTGRKLLSSPAAILRAFHAWFLYDMKMLLVDRLCCLSSCGLKTLSSLRAFPTSRYRCVSIVIGTSPLFLRQVSEEYF
jgi:hypothetical protein